MATLKLGALANSTVVVTSLVYGFLLTLAEFAGLLGLLLRLMITLSLYRYGYAVLRNVANGWNHFPPPDVESTNPFGQLTVVVHSMLFGSLLYLLASTPFIDGVLRWPLLLLVSAVFPASAAIMAMTRNAGAALNPRAIAGLVTDLGLDYARLLLVSMVLSLITALASDMPWYLGVLAGSVAVWTTLALFLATGATLRAHRHELDLIEGIDDAEQRELRDRQAQWQKILDRAYASVRSGLPAQAYRTIKELVDSEGESLEVHQWAFNGMLEWDDPRHAAMFGERFAKRLWDEGRKVDALELAQRCRKLSPSFLPPAAFATALATYARELGRHRLADELAELAATHRTAPP